MRRVLGGAARVVDAAPASLRQPVEAAGDRTHRARAVNTKSCVRARSRKKACQGKGAGGSGRAPHAHLPAAGPKPPRSVRRRLPSTLVAMDVCQRSDWSRLCGRGAAAYRGNVRGAGGGGGGGGAREGHGLQGRGTDYKGGTTRQEVQGLQGRGTDYKGGTTREEVQGLQGGAGITRVRGGGGDNRGGNKTQKGARALAAVAMAPSRLRALSSL